MGKGTVLGVYVIVWVFGGGRGKARERDLLSAGSCPVNDPETNSSTFVRIATWPDCETS